MLAENLRVFKRARPFRPFTIHVGSGEAYVVAHPELLTIVPDETLAIVASAPARVALIEIAGITDVSLETAARSPIGPVDADE